MGYSIGIDIGGTFTDVVLIADDGTVHTAKGLSTPPAFDRGILEILGALLARTGLAAGEAQAIVHGTTVATNAIIERQGAKTGLITTRGFRDVLELRRIRVPRLYDLTWEKPVPLVERYLRLEVDERIDHNGAVVTPLDPASVASALAELQRHSVEAVAVCLINAYANPAHERQIRTLIAAAAPSLHVTISSDVLPEMREYERTSTTVINAYVMPVVQRYVAALETGLRKLGFTTPLLLMQSNGGSMAAELAAETPVHIIESGPAAGVVACRKLARDMGIRNAVTFDIGGTTAKASLIEDGALAYAREYEVGAQFTRAGKLNQGGGYVVRAPTLDISEIGAGGGSIVTLDSGGALQVGPQSAGADPGPACYGRGGALPTLTDACLLLGLLDRDGLAGGAVPLDLGRAEAAFAPLAERLGMNVTGLAHGVYRIAVSNMTRAIRSVSIERGKDPRDFDLIAFGGNGGLFAAAVARELELRRVLLPPAAGIFSAFGLLYSDREHHFTRTLLGLLSDIPLAQVEAAWGVLEKQARATLQREGFASSDVRLKRFAELRYKGQTNELAVPWPDGDDTEILPRLAAAFEAAHERAYGHKGADGVVELVTLHLTAAGVGGRAHIPDRLRFAGGGRQVARDTQIWLGEGWVTARVLSRVDVPTTDTRGPIIVREFDTTVLVPSDFTICRKDGDTLVLTLP